MKKDFELFKEAKPFRLWDLAVYGAVLVLVAALLLVLFLPREAGGGVKIYFEGKQVADISFDDYSYPYICEYGGVRICVDNGNAYVMESDCPDKYCMRHDCISKDGESIICLPNQVIVKVYGGEKNEVAEVTR